MIEEKATTEHELQRLSRRAVLLCRLLASEHVRTYRSTKYPGFLVVDEGLYEPTVMMLVSADGQVIRNTIRYSGRNGDSYGQTEELLQPMVALQELQCLCDRLVYRVRCIEIKRIEADVRNELAARAAAAVELRLQEEDKCTL